MSLDTPASIYESTVLKEQRQTGAKKMLLCEVPKPSMSKQICSTSFNMLALEVPLDPLLAMSSNSGTEEENETEDIILDFHETKENVKTSFDIIGDSESCTSPVLNTECVSRLSSAFNTYSFNPVHYLKQIKKVQERGNYFMQKYQNELKTSIKRKKQIVILKRVLRDLQKRYRSLN